MRITVSGLPGSGTTSLSRYLAENHGFTNHISAGPVFRERAKEHNMELAEFGRGPAEKDAAYDKYHRCPGKRDCGEK